MDKASFLTKRLDRSTKVSGKMVNIKENAKVLKQNLLPILSTRKREILFLSIL